MSRLSQIALCLSFVLVFHCKKEFDFHGHTISLAAERVAKGEKKAQAVCSSCHIFPRPEELDRESWNYILAYMGLHLGFRNPEFLRHDPALVKTWAQRRDMLDLLNQIPAKPVISKEDFTLIRNYYLAAAPRDIEMESVRSKPLRQFKIHNKFPWVKDPAISMIRYLSRERKFVFGYGWSNKLVVANQKGVLETGFGVSSPPVDLDERKQGYFLTLLGDLLGNRPGEKTASVHYLAIGQAPVPLLPALIRTADTEVLDDKILFLSQFGVMGDGSLLRYALATRQKRKYLQGESVLKSAVLSASGRNTKLLVLSADAREKLRLLHFNKENLVKVETIVEKPPTTGYTMFLLADFNLDGKKDILTVNGDNLDAGPYNPLKKNHGIEIFAQTGQSHFEKKFSFSFFGAYTADTADLNGDKIPDIALTSAFTDERLPSNRGFVILMSRGIWQYDVYFMEGLPKSRYTLVQFIDDDEDGDMDILLAQSKFPSMFLKNGTPTKSNPSNSYSSVLYLQNIGSSD